MPNNKIQYAEPPPIATFDAGRLTIIAPGLEETIEVEAITTCFALVATPAAVAAKELSDLRTRINAYLEFVEDLDHDGRLPPDLDRRRELGQFVRQQIVLSTRYWKAHARCHLPNTQFSRAELAARNSRRLDIAYRRRVKLLAHLKAEQIRLEALSFPAVRIEVEPVVQPLPPPPVAAARSGLRDKIHGVLAILSHRGARHA